MTSPAPFVRTGAVRADRAPSGTPCTQFCWLAKWTTEEGVVPMAHYRKSVAAAVGLNTGIFVVEAVAGYQASSLSLIMDSLHNLSDELALVCLYLAFIVARGPSQKLLRSANVFNSVGLIAVSALLMWQAWDGMFNPVPVTGAVPIPVVLAPP